MRKDREWGYFRYDMRFDPLFSLKVIPYELIKLSKNSSSTFFNFFSQVKLTAQLPGWPIASLGWDKIERVIDGFKNNLFTSAKHDVYLPQDHVTDRVDNSLPTLEDLGVSLTRIEDQAPWELKIYRAHSYYDEELGEFEKPSPPPVAA